MQAPEGVLEPVNASPVVIEDEALVGGNCGVYEGTQVRARAVLGAGTILTRSTPVYDVVRGQVYRASGDQPLIIPENAVVVPGSRAFNQGKGAEWAVRCGVAHGALAMTTPGDTSMATLREVEKAMKGLGTRVDR